MGVSAWEPSAQAQQGMSSHEQDRWREIITGQFQTVSQTSICCRDAVQYTRLIFGWLASSGLGRGLTFVQKSNSD